MTNKQRILHILFSNQDERWTHWLGFSKGNNRAFFALKKYPENLDINNLLYLREQARKLHDLIDAEIKKDDDAQKMKLRKDYDVVSEILTTNTFSIEQVEKQRTKIEQLLTQGNSPLEVALIIGT